MRSGPLLLLLLTLGAGWASASCDGGSNARRLEESCGKGQQYRPYQNPLCVACPSNGHWYMDECGHTEQLCKSCPSGDSPDATSCGGSSGSSGSSESSTSSTSCGAGQYVYSADCRSCPLGLYQPAEGASHSSTSCSECPAGEIPNADTKASGCAACAAGQYRYSQAECRLCDPGKFAANEKDACDNCDAGAVSTETGTGCVDCEKGTYADSPAAACKRCEAGLFADQTKSTACQDCAVGTSSESQADGCELCEAGTFAREARQPFCKPCETGMFQDQKGQDLCLLCAAGQTTENAGQTSCENCTAGKFLSEGMRGSNSKCLECAGSSPGAASCGGCAPGKYEKKGSGQGGPKGGRRRRRRLNMNASKTLTCVTCPLGKFSPGGGQACKDCPRGYYDRRNLTELPGDDAGAAASFQCDACPMGRYSGKHAAKTDRSCKLCEAGKYSQQQGQAHSSTCIDCVPGRYNRALGADHESKCTHCPSGYRSEALGSKKPCEACTRGFFNPNRGSSDRCTACPAGYHQPREKQGACLLCIPGQYADRDAATTCKKCPANWFQNDVNATACVQCPIGRKAVVGSVRCSLCVAGNYSVGASSSASDAPEALLAACEECPGGWEQREQGKHECFKCKIGSFSTKGSPQCIGCQLGKYGRAPGETACSGCPDGKYQDGRGATSCKSCDADTYMSAGGQYGSGEQRTGAASKSECKKCKTERTTSGKNGSIGEISCLCKREAFYTEYSTGSPAGVCRTCPRGANCSSQDGSTVGTIFPEPGFWRQGNESTEFLSCASAYPGVNAEELAKQRCCPMMDSGLANASSRNVSLCRRGSSAHENSNIQNSSSLLDLEWHPDDQCAHGYKGPLCMICDSDYDFLRKGEHCEYCAAGKSDPVGAVVFLIISSLVLLLVVFAVASYTKKVQDYETRNELHDLDRDSIKILIGYMQIMSVMTQSFSSTSWPRQYKMFSTSMSFINFDVGFLMPSVSCTLSVPFTTKLIIHLVTPVIFLLAVKAGTQLAIVVNCKGEKSKERATAQSNVGDTIMINLCLLMYPGIATRTFAAFRCFSVGTNAFKVGDFLERDFEIKCYDSPEHHTLVALAVVSIIVYVAGVPLFLLYQLWRNRNALHDQEHDMHDMVAMKLGTLFRSYEKDYYYYEIICILQKMLLVGALSVVEQYSPVQLFLGTLICSGFMLLVLRTQPYKDDRLDQLSFLCSLMLTLTLLCGLVRGMDEHARGSTWLVEKNYPGAYGAVLVALNAVPFVFCGVLTLARWWKDRKEIGAELIEIEHAIERKLSRKGTGAKKKQANSVKVSPAQGGPESFWEEGGISS